MSEQETGVVKWFNSSRGYGFVIRDNAAAEPRECFFHATELKKSKISDSDVDEGHRLSFVVENTPRGIAAKRIAKL
jgi:CspA family cold shock protein